MLCVVSLPVVPVGRDLVSGFGGDLAEGVTWSQTVAAVSGTSLQQHHVILRSHLTLLGREVKMKRCAVKDVKEEERESEDGYEAEICDQQM